jgi:3-deoxy-D-manno-octulosonic-acid transferase
MMLVLYRLIAYLTAPVLVAHFLWRSLRDPAWRRGISQRLGLTTPVQRPRGIWLHASSVGEVQAIAPLIRALRRASADLPLTLTTFTPTGRARARELFEELDVVTAYLPMDLPGAVTRVLRQIRPKALLVAETELWPELFHACGSRGISVHLVSARVSPSAFLRYRWLRGLLAPALAAVSTAGVQTATDGERLVALGLDPDRVVATGSLKFDLELPASVLEQGEAIRGLLGPSRPIWVAASTRPGEESLVLETHTAVLKDQPDALLVMAPRHPERFDEVAAQIERAGSSLVRRSDAAPVGAQVQVLLLDTLGELTSFLAAADLAFVGGSLVPLGGHNVLEPAALARPVVTGPHLDNIVEVARDLQVAGGLVIVRDGEGLTATVRQLLADPEQRLRRGEAARGVLEANRGALERTLAMLGDIV